MQKVFATRNFIHEGKFYVKGEFLGYLNYVFDVPFIVEVLTEDGHYIDFPGEDVEIEGEKKTFWQKVKGLFNGR